jgi:hypothetical protein
MSKQHYDGWSLIFRKHKHRCLNLKMSSSNYLNPQASFKTHFSHYMSVV